MRKAKNAESRADFIHILAVAHKEGDENLYWLELLFASKYIHHANYESLINDTMEILENPEKFNPYPQTKKG